MIQSQIDEYSFMIRNKSFTPWIKQWLKMLYSEKNTVIEDSGKNVISLKLFLKWIFLEYFRNKYRIRYCYLITEIKDCLLFIFISQKIPINCCVESVAFLLWMNECIRMVTWTSQNMRHVRFVLPAKFRASCTKRHVCIHAYLQSVNSNVASSSWRTWRLTNRHVNGA